MFKLFKKKKKIGCPVCHEKNTVGFGTDYLASKFESKISESEKIGITQTYQCSICKSIFYKELNMFQKFAKGQIERLREFIKRDLQLNDTLRSELDSIGLSEDYAMVKLAPARVRLKNGDSYDFATIRVSNDPPIGYDLDLFSKVIFIDEVESIEPSEFGLSKKIRDKARNALEMRMGFYPVSLQTRNGERVIINGQTLFFRNKEIKGAGLIPSNERWDYSENYIFEDKIENQVLIVAKI